MISSRSLCTFLTVFLTMAAAAGANNLRDAQTILKEQGFYYGEVTGASSSETTAALKRYQIRNGLEVTGTLNAETLASLGLSGSPIAASPPPAPQDPIPLERPSPTPAAKPPVDLRKDTTRDQDDREFLKRQQSSAPPQRSAAAPPNAQPPRPSQPSAPAGPYGRVFSRTPYASAPLEVQRDTIRRAQVFLKDLGFYGEALDGIPGPALEEGLLSYQRFIALPLTGRLDLETLSAMRLLPGRGGVPTRTANPQVRPSKQPLRGVWID
jgi:peptidoglycan hydrolase-like protein with peptidoglycan-binding domain